MLVLTCRQFSKVDKVIDKAVTFLEGQLDSVSDDVYTLAICTYALSLADSPKASQALSKLNSLATSRGILYYLYNRLTAQCDICCHDFYVTHQVE